LDQIADNPAAFPSDVLKGAQTGLCVFAAEWHGKQDAQWLARAGIRTTCVDRNRQKLAEMEMIYPDGWQFSDIDAFGFVQNSLYNGLRWDVVTADPFTGQAMDRCHRELDQWCKLANNAVVMGSTIIQQVERAPAGWRIAERRYRGDYVGGVYWTVLLPC
jgi:hypothetical protein